MFLGLHLLSFNASRPIYQRQTFNMAENTLPTSQLCLLMDTEGDSPLEVAIAIIKDGVLTASKRWLCKPVVTRERERWSIRNIHGIGYDHAHFYGLSRPDLKFKVAAWLAENIGPLPEGTYVNVYFPGAIGTGDTEFYQSLKIPYLAEANFIALDKWTERVTKAYHTVQPQANVELCQQQEHTKYDPDDFKLHRIGHKLSATKWAKLESGYHCALKDVVELYQYMQEWHYFDKDFPLAL
jgi:hypothetical protein